LTVFRQTRDVECELTRIYKINSLLHNRIVSILHLDIYFLISLARSVETKICQTQVDDTTASIVIRTSRERYNV